MSVSERISCRHLSRQSRALSSFEALPEEIYLWIAKFLNEWETARVRCLNSSLKSKLMTALVPKCRLQEICAKKYLGGYAKFTTKELSQLLEQKAYALVQNLWGSEESFKAIPLLEREDTRDERGYIYIGLGDVTAPIMRGEIEGQKFVVVIAWKNGALYGSVLFQRYPNSAHWTDTKVHGCYGRLINFEDYFITNGGLFFNLNGYRSLRKMIQIGRVDIEEKIYWSTLQKMTQEEFVAAQTQWRAGKPILHESHVYFSRTSKMDLIA